MKILVLNCGSSSVKYKLFDMSKNLVIAQGGVEKLGMKGSMLLLKLPNGEKVTLEGEILEHQTAIEYILGVLVSEKYGAVKCLEEIDAVGHRVVHGGEAFNKSVLITDEVMKAIEDCVEMAPLHNPPNLEGVNAIKELLPTVPQVAVFDTAFHQTMPKKAYMYGIPYSLYKKYKVRRYGFHGTSYRFVSQRVCEILDVAPSEQRIIACHLGNGGSISAIVGGKCVDTSMGFTPLEGLLMGTRSGDIDPGVAGFLMDKEMIGTSSLSSLLNKYSGVLGVSGISSDMRTLAQAVEDGDKRAILALDMYVYRIRKYIGAYTAAMGGVDIILFTGGVGENQCSTRARVCEGFEYLGLELDPERNKVMGEDAVISTDASRVKLVVVPTDEEYMIASDTLSITTKV